MGCFNSSKTDRNYDSSYSSAGSSRFSSVSSSRSSSHSSQSSNRSAVPSQFVAKSSSGAKSSSPVKYTIPSPQANPSHAKLSLHDDTSGKLIPLSDFGNSIHRVNVADPERLEGFAETFVCQFFEESQHQIHTWDHLKLCFTHKYNGNDLSVDDDRIKQLLWWYFDICFVDENDGNTWLYKMKIDRNKQVGLVRNGREEPPPAWSDQ